MNSTITVPLKLGHGIDDEMIYFREKDKLSTEYGKNPVIEGFDSPFSFSRSGPFGNMPSGSIRIIFGDSSYGVSIFLRKELNFVFRKIMNISSRRNVIIADPLNFNRTFSLADTYLEMGLNLSNEESLEDMSDDDMSDDDEVYSSDGPRISFDDLPKELRLKWTTASESEISDYFWRSTWYLSKKLEKEWSMFLSPISLFLIILTDPGIIPLYVRIDGRNYLPKDNIFWFDTGLQHFQRRVYIVNLQNNGIRNLESMRKYIMRGPSTVELENMNTRLVSIRFGGTVSRENVNFEVYSLEYRMMH
jgi:hypothetical protein